MLISASNSSREGISAWSSSWKFLGVRKALLSLKEFTLLPSEDLKRKKIQTFTFIL
jgi:hypothetical protein